MKILAVRGENIASLCERFDVDLCSGALGDAGLFAISGPTGAGKSTLLDIICLALFDRTPRLAERGGASVGRADDDPGLLIRSNDVRGLLSRGAGKGFAEVDFRGVDGARYRARWEVRRARNKPSGRLQNQDMSLECLDTGRRHGDKKTEVLAHVESFLGLTFDQFKRSAMLAQGDFAAFLHASDDDRANLLERVTGTEIYGQISRASYRRTATEQEALNELTTQARLLGRLTPDERAQLVADEAEARDAMASAIAEHESAQKAVAWFVERDRLARRVTEAQQGIDTAERARTSAQSRREQLERVLAMAPLRLPLERRNDARDALQKARDAHTAAVEHKRAAEEALKDAEAAMATRRTERDAARTARVQAEPDLARARALDARLGDARAAVADADERVKTAQASLTEATRERDRLDEVIRRAETQAAAGRAWAEAHPDAERLGNVIATVQRAAGELHQAQQTLATLAEQLPTLSTQAAQAATALATAKAGQETCAASETAAATALQQAEAALPEGARGELDARRATLDSLQEHRRQLARAIEDAADATQRRKTLTGEHTALTEEVEAVATSIAQDQAALQRNATALVAAEHHLDKLRSARSAEELRTTLTPGEPCSVCGSTEHPWAEGGVLDSLHAEARTEVERLRTAQTGLERSFAAATARRDAINARLPQLIAENEAAEARLRAAQTRWTEHRTASDALPEHVVTDAAVLVPLDERIAELTASHQRDSSTLHALEEAVRTAGREHKVALAAHRSARSRLESATDAAHTTRTALEACERGRDQAQRDRDGALQELDDALAGRDGWRDAALADAPALARTLADEVAQWQSHKTVLSETTERIATATPERASAEASRHAAQTDLTAQQANLDAARKRLDELTTERTTLFGGRPADAVALELTEHETTAEQALGKAEKERGAAAEALSSHDGTVKTRAAAMSEAARAAEGTQSALVQALSARDVDEQTATRLLAWTPDQVDEESRALAALDRAVHDAVTVRKERSAAVEEHAASRPEGDEEALRHAASRAEAAEKSAREVHADHAARLRRDDKARTDGEELDQALATQQLVVNDWKAISDVIGSASGKVFQTFAQGLTLDALLMHANHHLRDLAPRYRLERVPRENLALQVVDMDMGDEVRAIPSLSGGETFLTSLALALGLSSLAASETPVESLFIDEGFGTLDRETLEIALAALDALQASGRQVGLISHVDGLSEHIGVAVRVEKLGAGRSRVVLPERAIAS